MTEYTEDYCLAILMTSLKRRNRYPDPITVAECAQFLYKMHGSFERVSRMVEVHPSVVRKWVNLASAPQGLRQSVKEGKIYPVAAFAILSAFKDDNKIEDIAREVCGWGEPEIVRFIRFVKHNCRWSVSECKRMFINEVTRRLLSSNDKPRAVTD